MPDFAMDELAKAMAPPVVPAQQEKLRGPQPPNADYRDGPWLQHRYIAQCQTMTEIAKECGVTAVTIQNWLDRHGIPTRPRGGNSRTKAARTPRRLKTYDVMDADELLTERQVAVEALTQIDEQLTARYPHLSDHLAQPQLL